MHCWWHLVVSSVWPVLGCTCIYMYMYVVVDSQMRLNDIFLSAPAGIIIMGCQNWYHTAIVVNFGLCKLKYTAWSQSVQFLAYKNNVRKKHYRTCRSQICFYRNSSVNFLLGFIFITRAHRQKFTLVLLILVLIKSFWSVSFSLLQATVKFLKLW